jgi:long-chain fatty acid transport protein
MRKSLLIPLVAMVGLAFSVTTVTAGAFRIPEAGATAMGQGNAFVGQADDPSAVHHNPAAITGLEGIQILAGMTMITPESEFEGESAEKETFYPPYFFYTNQISDSDWYLGFGVSAPFGLGTEWDEDAGFNQTFRSLTPLNPVDAVTETVVEIAKIAPVAAYRINDQFSVGFGPEYYDVMKVVYKGGSSDGAGTGFEYSLKGDGDGLGYVLSGLYQASDSLRIGFAWHSGVTAELTGNAANFPDDVGVPQTTKASVDLNLPDTMALGIHYEISDVFSVNLDLDQTQWSDYEKLEFKYSNGSVLRTINKEYEDVLAIRAGGQYRINDNWTVRGGFLIEPTPVIEETFDPRVPDSDASGITVGAGYDADSWAVNFAYMALSKKDRDVDSDEPAALPTLFDGEYKSSVDLLSTDVTFRF